MEVIYDRPEEENLAAKEEPESTEQRLQHQQRQEDEKQQHELQNRQLKEEALQQKQLLLQEQENNKELRQQQESQQQNQQSQQQLQRHHHQQQQPQQQREHQPQHTQIIRESARPSAADQKRYSSNRVSPTVPRLSPSSPANHIITRNAFPASSTIATTEASSGVVRRQATETTESGERRRRAQSCSTPENGGSPPPPPRAVSRGTSPKSTTSKQRHRLDATSSASCMTPSMKTSRDLLSVTRSQSQRNPNSRRLSPATLEAARLALVTRADPTRRRPPSHGIETASFFVVTSDGERKLDAKELEALLRYTHRRTERRHRPSSRSSSGGREGEGKGSRQSASEVDGGGGGNSSRQSRETVDSIGDDPDQDAFVRRQSHRSSSTAVSASPSPSYPNSPKRRPRPPLSRTDSKSSALQTPDTSRDPPTDTLPPSGGGGHKNRLSSVSSADGRGSRSSRRDRGVSTSPALSHKVSSRSEHYQRVRFDSTSHDSIDTRSIKSNLSLGGGSRISAQCSRATIAASPVPRDAGEEESDAGDASGRILPPPRWYKREKLFGRGPNDKPSVVKFVIAGVVMLAGTCAFLLSYILGRGEAWSLVGSTVMGVGSLLIVLGVCWYLSITPTDRADSAGRVEVRVVDQAQLAMLIEKGACVQTVTMQTC